LQSISGRILAQNAPVCRSIRYVYANFPRADERREIRAKWDVALIGGSTPSRATVVVFFSAVYERRARAYLVRAGVPITAASDVDAPGVRVGVLEEKQSR
jgi:ABC-type amino acid transport substrate-binding protein